MVRVSVPSMASSLSDCTSETLFLLFCLLILYNHFAYSIQFHVTQFDQNETNVIYQGDAEPSLGAVELTNELNHISRVGRLVYADRVRLWNADTKQLSDFNTRFSFIIDTQNATIYSDGLAFFIAPFGFQIPFNSAAGFLGLFNTTTAGVNVSTAKNQIVHVEFDTYSNIEWDPPFEHVGINKNSISSEVYTSWNASFHSGDTSDVRINYNATSMNLSVSWAYRRTSSARENTSLSCRINLMEVLPEWVTIGFSAATGIFGERHILKSWEFSSSLDVKESAEDTETLRLTLGLTISGAFVIAAGLITALVTLRKRKKKKRKAIMEMANLTILTNKDIEDGAGGPRRFSYTDLVSATNNFSDERRLGEGGFGAVYKGFLDDSNSEVAVKKISKGSRQGRKEYITEVKVISRLRHRNLVKLMGWCHDRGEFLLVYELMPNGSLDSHLFGNRSLLNWDMRYKIALGLASALLYLHEEWEQCVVHRDIKPSNIMLDSNFNSKLGDFGLARLVNHELGPQTTGLAGTLGYLAPEYITTGRVSKEADVYSFGVVVTEIATGRKSVGVIEKDMEMGLIEWVWDLYGKGMIFSAVDERLQIDHHDLDLRKQVESLMIVGLWCAHPDRSLRPSIMQAIHVLNFEATFPKLPSKMPIPMFHMPPTPSVSSNEPLISTSLEVGR